MATWSNDELDTIGRADELQIAPRRRDGTLRTPVTIWVVRVGDDVYVRSVRGRTSGWFGRVRERHEGHISAGGVEKDVAFVEVGVDEAEDEIGEAYGAKYGGRYPAAYIDPLLTAEARAATLRLDPR
jgi:hypothetical protein